MPLVLIPETGAIVPGANGYASVDQFNDYHEARAHTGSAAINLDGRVKELRIIEATRLFDAILDYQGWAVDPYHSVRWPRFDVPGPDWIVLAPDAIPSLLVYATCEQAYAVEVEDRLATKEDGIVQSVSMGRTSVTYGRGGGTSAGGRSVIASAARAYLAPLLRPGQVMRTG